MATIYNTPIRKNTVYQSNNYDLIQVFEFNRFTGIGKPIMEGQTKEFERRLNKMKAILSKNGYNPHLPILCAVINGVLIACDGNTRIIACRELGIPFYYEIDETIDTIEKLCETCFLMNNTGTKWTAKDKIYSATINPTFTEEQRKNAGTIAMLSNKYGIALSTVLYVASNGNGHKSDVLANKTFVIAPDTEYILQVANDIARRNFYLGLGMLKRDKFVEAVMLALRNTRNISVTVENLLKRGANITDQKSSRKNWNWAIQYAANYNLKSNKNMVNIL